MSFNPEIFFFFNSCEEENVEAFVLKVLNS